MSEIKISKKHNHDHFWVEDGVLFESYKTTRGMRYNDMCYIKHNDCEKITLEEIESCNLWR